MDSCATWPQQSQSHCTKFLTFETVTTWKPQAQNEWWHDIKPLERINPISAFALLDLSIITEQSDINGENNPLHSLCVQPPPSKSFCYVLYLSATCKLVCCLCCCFFRLKTTTNVVPWPMLKHAGSVKNRQQHRMGMGFVDKNWRCISTASSSPSSKNQMTTWDTAWLKNVEDKLIAWLETMSAPWLPQSKPCCWSRCRRTAPCSSAHRVVHDRSCVRSTCQAMHLLPPLLNSNIFKMFNKTAMRPVWHLWEGQWMVWSNEDATCHICENHSRVVFKLQLKKFAGWAFTTKTQHLLQQKCKNVYICLNTPASLMGALNRCGSAVLGSHLISRIDCKGGNCQNAAGSSTHSLAITMHMMAATCRF